MSSTSYPESPLDWRGRFIANLATALARREDIILTRLTVPQGIQIVLSGGISIPQVLRQEVSSHDGR